MVDIKEENKIELSPALPEPTSPAPQPGATTPYAPTSAHTPPPAESPHKLTVGRVINAFTMPGADEDQKDEVLDTAGERVKSGGEILFNRLVYTGVGFGVNEASSLWFTEQFMYGENLLEKKLFKWLPESVKTHGSWFSKQGFEDISKLMVKYLKFSNTDRAGGMLLTAALLSGGTALVLPMKKLEDHKSYLVKKCNHIVDWFKGSKLSDEEVKARDTQVEKDIACLPKQSWPSMLIGRGLGMASSLSFGAIMGERFDNVQNFSERLLTGKMFRGQPATPKKERNKPQRYAGLFGVETLCCTLTAVVLEVTSKFFAGRMTQVHNPKLCNQAKEESAPVSGNPAAPVDTDKKDSPSPQTKSAPDLQSYKSRKVSPTEKHTDLAKAGEPNYSLAP